MITIYRDFHHIQSITPTSTTFVASRIQDYIPLRKWLRNALDNVDTEYEAYIQFPILGHWLKDLIAYDPQIITWKEIRLDTYFEQRFGFLPPKGLGETQQRDLIHTLQPPHEKIIADPIGWILSQKFHPIWESIELDTHHLVNLSEYLVKGPPIPSSFLPLIKTRIIQWAALDIRYQFFLDIDFKQAASKIFSRWALRMYPLPFISALDLNNVPLVDCSQHTHVCIEQLKLYHALLRDFWYSRLLENTKANIQQTIDAMSGLSDAELDMIDTLTKKNVGQLSEDLLEHIKVHFSHLPRTKNITEALKKVIPPPTPNQPLSHWSTRQWLDWVTDEYMPYFSWVIRTNQPRTTQMQLARHFEDWLIAHYPKLPQDSRAPFAPHQLDEIKKPFKSRSADVVFWFIIDGLTWWQGKKLQSFCQERDITSSLSLFN
ncbi:hypothetical protein KDW_39200 [Dictyobacter vulcani]|uniref:Uncharacterized protein n=1 Tax=Dictyobacter vulcani TaxID=2607529 RepID=A0A5J4KJ69_9CHLR|nr:hypothetical protein [Dictyobacter vulcani]GER89758.1 hypothetical protein KDW_39200 [Dictyobacter vulcani]